MGRTAGDNRPGSSGGRLIGEVDRIPDRIVAALEDVSSARAAAFDTSPSTYAEHAVRAAHLAALSAREAAWWRLLAHWSFRAGAVHRLHGKAAVIAADERRDDARFRRDAAADGWGWPGRPTSDAAGAMSNRSELGVAG